MDGGVWVALGAECCSGEYKKAGEQKANAKRNKIKRQVGRRRMGSEWQEGLAGAGDGVWMLEGMCSALCAYCTFSGMMACSKAAVKAGIVSKHLPSHA